MDFKLNQEDRKEKGNNVWKEEKSWSDRSKNGGVKNFKSYPSIEATSKAKTV